MTFDQLQNLFEPAGTGQQYTDSAAMRNMFRNARPISEAPLEVQFNNQKMLRNNATMGDITAPIITDYSKYNMTMGPTTYTQENRIGAEREYRESQYADRAATTAALADMRARASGASSAPRLVNTKQVEQDPIYSPEEKLQMERTRLVMSKLPPEQQLMLNRAMRQHHATTTPAALAVASQDYK